MWGGGVKQGMNNFGFYRNEGNRCGIGVELHHQLDNLGDAGFIEIVLHRFGVASRQAFGVVMRFAGAQRLGVRFDKPRQVFQLQRMEMPAVLVRLQFAVVRVDVFGMIMSERPETEVERP